MNAKVTKITSSVFEQSKFPLASLLLIAFISISLCTSSFAQPVDPGAESTLDCSLYTIDTYLAAQFECNEQNLNRIMSGYEIQGAQGAGGGSGGAEVISNCDPNAETTSERVEEIYVSVPQNTGASASASFTLGADGKLADIGLSAGGTVDISTGAFPSDPTSVRVDIPAIPACHKFTYQASVANCNLAVIFKAKQCIDDGGVIPSWSNEFTATTSLAVYKVDLRTHPQVCSEGACACVQQ